MAEATIPTSKVCTKCGEAKPRADFQKRSATKDGLHSRCRLCQNAAQRARYDPESNREACRKWRSDNSEKAKAADRARYTGERKARASELKKAAWSALTTEEREAKRLAVREWMAANPDKVRATEVARNERIRAQRQADPDFNERLKRKSLDWTAEKRRTDPVFREKVNAANRQWHKENKDRQNAYKRKLNAKRRKTDVVFRLKGNIRARLRVALRGTCRGSAVRMLGCTVEDLRSHIERQFQPGMNWENWGRGWAGAREWHIDHIKPLAGFDLTDPVQLAAACHYTNLQPLWASDNLLKGAR